MLRYVAFLWSADEPEKTRIAQALSRRLQVRSLWRTASSAPGFVVLCTGLRSNSSELHPLGKDAGVVLGSLFERKADLNDESPARVACLTDDDVARILASQGRRLIDSYWGSYVAFVRDPANAKMRLIRAPINAPPCMLVESGGLTVLFSSMSDCMALGLRSYSIDWRYVAAHLALGRPQGSATGLSEVSNIGLGECVTFEASGRTSSQYWNPGAIAQDTIADAEMAVAALRATVRSCVHSWAARHSGILLRLSGGVDSSIVLACLRDAPSRPAVTALHHFWPGKLREDERIFARAATGHTGCSLVEAQRESGESFKGILTAAPSPMPSEFPYRELFAREARFASDARASAIFCGTLGDALFHLSPAMPAASEHLRAYGVRRAFLKVVMDVAEFERTSFWQVLRSSVRDGWTRKTRSPWSPYRQATASTIGSVDELGRLLAPEAIAMYESRLADYIHPWLHSVDDVPLGKLPQIYLLPFDDYWRNPFAGPDDPEELPPYASQPLVELCLRIPTYFNIADGYDRAVARKAFGRDLPEIIARRRSKGSPDAWTRQVIAGNAEFVKEMLLDGLLVKQGLLDRRKLATAMPGELSTSQCPVGCITQHLCTEAWVQQWNEARGCATVPARGEVRADSGEVSPEWLDGSSLA